MVTVLIVLASITLFATILDSLKDVWTHFSKIFSLIIIGLAVAAFIFTIFVAYGQDKDSTEGKQSIDSIKVNLEKQMKRIDDFRQQTDILLDKADSSRILIEQVLADRQGLISQYKQVNERFKNQILIEEKLIKERAPKLEIKSFNVTRNDTDSNTYSVRACIGNYGSRNVQIKSQKGVVLFFDDKNNVIANLPFPEKYSTTSLLSPYSIEQETLCYVSYRLRNFRLMDDKPNSAVIFIQTVYRDFLVEKDSTTSFYISDDFKHEFGVPKDWVINLVNQWLQKQGN